MLDNQLRRIKERVLGGVARKLFAHTPPALLSLLGFITGVGAAGAIYCGADGAALGLWVGSRILDGLDGTVARVHNKESATGGYLDLMLDSVVYVLFPIAVALHARDTVVYIAVLGLLGVYYVNVLSWTLLSAMLERNKSAGAGGGKGVGAESKLTSIRIPTGVVEGTETVVIYGLLCIIPHEWRLHVIIATAILTLAGACWRVLWVFINRARVGGSK